LAKLAKALSSESMTHTFTIGEAKTNLSKLIALAEQGETVELRRGKEPVARLVALPRAGGARRRPGALAGKVVLTEDFDSWPEDVAAALGATD
jgi:antitoxin (DNA-binding transcriptional repressor) of toxin-antitoxin stability system